MDSNLDNLKKLFESIKTISFFNRIFGWRKIRNQLIDAAADLQKLISNIETFRETILKLESSNSGLDKDIQLKNEILIKKDAEIEKKASDIRDLSGRISKFTESSGIASQTILDLNQRKSELDIELAEVKKDLQNSQAELAEVKRQNTLLIKDEEFRKQEHSNSLAALSKIQDQIQKDRTQEIEERNALEIQRIRELRETWSKHQENAKNSIRSICQKYTINYVEKVPFKGDPDNTLMICDEYIIFDAKSPGGEDLKNFPNYLKDQAEKARKYAKQENVKSDIFFVVPSNTLDYLESFVYRHGDHTVYIISVDALEPIALSLQKIEAYEYAKELSPEDRENICRVLGRFAHLSKRRIQVDSFFARQFIELAYKCETDLPKDILESVIEFERTEKLNPPQEKRAKSIPLGELEKENKKINQEAAGRGILIDDTNISNRLNELPLYKTTGE